MYVTMLLSRSCVLVGLGALAVALLGGPVRGGTPGNRLPSGGLRVEDQLPRYGGYLPPGGYPADSGAPLGGYTPFSLRVEGRWLRLDYGFDRDDFGPAYRFGEARLRGGPRHP
jgi:hypothetical protein